MGLLEETLRGKSLADYTNTQLRLALGAVLYTNTADMWKQYLNQIGYTGDVSQMLQKYYVDYSVPSNFRNYINAGASIFNPQNMFAVDAALQGYVYDINDLSTLYLDSAGTTPASVNGAVGLVLDKSKGLALGAELIVNSAWFAQAGWSVNPSTGVATATAVTGYIHNNDAGGTRLTIGKWYRATIRLVSYTSGSVGYPYDGTGFISIPTTPGTYTYDFLCDGNEFTYVYGVAFTGVVDSISVKELPGNHAYQSTTGNKPVLRGTPVGGNLVTNGDFASGTGWTAGAGWAIGSGVATATTSSSTLTSTLTATASKNYRVTYTITRSAGSVQVSFGGRTGVSRSAAGTYVDYLDSTTNTNALVFTGTGFSGTVDNIEVVDVTAGSVKAPYALQFDGSDDFLQTAAVDFTATDKMTVCHGVRKLSDAAQGIFAELSESAISNNGSWVLLAPSSGGEPNFLFASKGTTPVVSQGSALIYPAPSTKVLTGIGDISGDIITLRTNGAGLTSNPDQGTGNYGNYKIYFGRRGGTTAPLNGLMFSAICVGKTASATELANIERWVNLRTGAY